MLNNENMSNRSPFNSDVVHCESKAIEIIATCDARNISELAKLATSEYGLINDDIRRIAWPMLLGCRGASEIAKSSDWTSLPHHRDENQVRLDVDRAFVYYPNGQS